MFDQSQVLGILGEDLISRRVKDLVDRSSRVKTDNVIGYSHYIQLLDIGIELVFRYGTICNTIMLYREEEGYKPYEGWICNGLLSYAEVNISDVIERLGDPAKISLRQGDSSLGRPFVKYDMGAYEQIFIYKNNGELETIIVDTERL